MTARSVADSWDSDVPDDLPEPAPESDSGGGWGDSTPDPEPSYDPPS